jgi:hypothetical protein
MMENLASPVDKRALAREVAALAPLVKKTPNGDLIYDVSGEQAPLCMREISRLREVSFRRIGSGSGRPSDLDAFDVGAQAYRQLFVFSPRDNQIVAGLRHRRPTHPDDQHVASSGIFDFSRQFRDEYLANMIDLGRMFVAPLGQGLSGGKRGIYSLDNLFLGVGAVVGRLPDIQYLFGRIVHSPLQSVALRDLVVSYLDIHHGDTLNLVRPRQASRRESSGSLIENVLSGHDPMADLRSLRRFAKSNGEGVSALLRAYLQMCPTLITFGTAADWELSGIEETCLLVPVAQTTAGKRARYLRKTKVAHGPSKMAATPASEVNLL